MVRLFALVVILLIMIFLGVFTLFEHPLPQADFTYAISDSIETLDPAQMSWHNENQLAMALWEGLVTYHPKTLEPVEGAAYLPPRISADGCVYTFELRKGACWSNGDPVTAADFIRGWRRAIEPGIAKDYKFLLLDYILGAKNYYDWRNDAVGVLTHLRDLREGKKELAEVLEEDPNFLEILNLPSPPSELPSWSEIAERFRQNHVAQMDTEFAKVGIQALDAHRLQIRLLRPVTYMLDLLGWVTFMPVHKSVEMLRVTDDPIVQDLTLWAYDPQWTKPDYHQNGYPGLVSNGPFRLDQWQFKRYMLLRRNPHYWDQKTVRSATIMVRIITEKNTAWLSYERGEVDWLDYLSTLDFTPTLIEQARQGIRHDIHLSQSFASYYYNFNCKDKMVNDIRNPFIDARVRMAFALAADKEAIVSQVRKLGNPAAYYIVPPNSIPGYKCPKGPRYDPVRARQLLADAGYPQGKGLGTVEILYNTGQDHDITAQAIAEMWRKQLGAEITLRGKETKTFSEDKKNQRFLIARASWYGDYMDPTTFLDLMRKDNGNNDSGFYHPEFEALMEQAADTLEPQERLRILAQAENLLLQQEMPILPLFYRVDVLAFRPNVKGLYTNARDTHPLKYVYVER
jgi:oligopeptide transport system substrate-binding protein